MSSDQRSTWVIITDTNTCKVYSYNRKEGQITRIKELQHLENKLKDSDLVSDKQGQYRSSGDAGHGTYSPQSDPKEVKIDAFAREIAKALDHGRTTHAYHDLVIIASPHMDGLLFQHFNKHVKDLVSHNIEKDLLHMQDRELLDFLREHTKFPGES